MKHYSQAAVERTMKVQEVIMRAMAKKIKWYQAADILLDKLMTKAKTKTGHFTCYEKRTF